MENIAKDLTQKNLDLLRAWVDAINSNDSSGKALFNLGRQVECCRYGRPTI